MVTLSSFATYYFFYFFNFLILKADPESMLNVDVQGHLHPDGGGDVVVLHPHHDQLLHRQPGW